ncbi:MAG: aldolase/citrate lyase family protein, partial [Bacteroidota bacterium]|nr:aldolase/citrate lyase family protein [Bacteroidota bacterium]
KTLFGDSILNLANNILEFFNIENCNLVIMDRGALDFIIAARIEVAIKKIVETEKEYLLPKLLNNTLKTTKDRFRLSRLYLPGNSPKLMINAGVHNPEGIILDLEDSVAEPKKFEARFLVRNALRNVDFYGAERMVRINQLPLGFDDLEIVIPQNPNLILLPKCESAQQVLDVVQKIKQIKNNEDNSIWIMPIIESALGVEKSFEIATASEKVVALAIGLEDFTADLGVPRTQDANESLYARTRIVNACKAAKIQPIDSVFSDVSDMEGLYQNVLKSRSLGFEGMGCIHPRQIAVIQKAFIPSDAEIEKAKKIVEAFKIAEEKGLGVVSLGSKMIDPPVVKRALQILKLIENQ